MSKPIEPAKPIAMELVFLYACPHCGHNMIQAAPLRPILLLCEMCRKQFPIVPVDERTVQFVKIILANGCAAIDQDYL